MTNLHIPILFALIVGAAVWYFLRRRRGDSSPTLREMKDKAKERVKKALEGKDLKEKAKILGEKLRRFRDGL